MNIGSNFKIEGIDSIIIDIDDHFVMYISGMSVALRATPRYKLQQVMKFDEDEYEFAKAISFSEFYSLISLYYRKKHNVKRIIDEVRSIWVNSNYDVKYLRSVIREAELLARNRDTGSESPIELLRSVRRYL